MKCEICGKGCSGFVGLAGHITRIHNISVKEYYDRYLKKDGEGICHCGESTAFINLRKGYCINCSRKCTMSNLEVLERRKANSLQKFGTEYPTQSESFKEKYRQTFLQKYGVENASQVQSILDKKKATSLANYGVDNPSKSEIVKQKMKNTFLNNYGVENPSYCSSVVKKRKETSLKNYGVDNPSKSEIVKERIRDIFFNKYGVEYWAQSLDGRESSRKTAIKCVETQKLNGLPLMPRIGLQEPEFFEKLQSHIDCEISYQTKLHGYFPDGYIEELDLIIEFDEAAHFTDPEMTQYKERDFIKNETYEKYGHKVFRVSEKEWQEDRDKVIERFKNNVKS